MDFRLGCRGGVVDVPAFFFAQAGDLDFANASLRIGLNADGFWQVDCGLSHAAANVDLVRTRGRAAQIQLQFADAQFDIDAAQRHAAEIHVRFPGAKVGVDIHGDPIVETEVPSVFLTSAINVAAGRLFNGEFAPNAGVGVAKLGLPGRNVVGEIGLGQLRRSASDVELSSAHAEIDASHFDLVEIDGFGFMLGGTGWDA